MKTTTITIVALSILSSLLTLPVLAAEVSASAGTGLFKFQEFQENEDEEIWVLSPIEGLGPGAYYGVIGGKVTPKTKVEFYNRTPIPIENLDLLNDRCVTAMARWHLEGEGERTEVILDELLIFVENRSEKNSACH